MRQTAVALGVLLAVVGAVVGSGAVVGTPIAQAAGGALSTTATLVAPAGPAFAIWLVVYAGLVGLAVLQALPSRRADPRHRSAGWPVAASTVLNAAWISVVQAGWLGASVLVIVALAAALAVAWSRLLRSRPTSWVDAVLLDGTTGLHLGWVCIATVANAAALVADSLAPSARTGTTAQALAVVVLAGAAVLGVALAVRGRGRLAAPAALAWGLGWIAAARSTAAPGSGSAALTAGAAAAATLAAVVVVRARRRRARLAPAG